MHLTPPFVGPSLPTRHPISSLRCAVESVLLACARLKALLARSPLIKHDALPV